MAQDIEIPHEYIANIHKSQYLIQLLNIVQKEAGNRPFRLCDINKHPEPSKRKRYGRYEHDKQIIWIRLGLPSYVTEFVVAHELGHLLQEVRGYPRVSIRDILRNFKVSNGQKQLVYPDIIVRIHSLTDGISNLLLDFGADEIANTFSLLTKKALEYLLYQDKAGIKSITLPKFDSGKFRLGIEEVLNKIKGGKNPSSHFDLVCLIESVRLATRYVTHKLRYDRYGLFELLDNIYKENLPTVHEFGVEFANIAQIDKLQTPSGCKEVAKSLVQYLQIPREAVGIKTAGGWCD